MKILDILATIGLITVLRVGCKVAVWGSEVIKGNNTKNDDKTGGH